MGLCPNCGSNRIKAEPIEIWQREPEFIYDETLNKLVEVEPKVKPYVKEESYDSRAVTCLDCSWKASTPDIPIKIELLMDDVCGVTYGDTGDKYYK